MPLFSGISNKLLGCWDSYKVGHLVDRIESTINAALVSGAPDQVLQPSSDTGGVSIISGSPPCSPSLDCFHIVFWTVNRDP